MKKVITLVLVICMLLSMCACGTKPAKAPSAPAETKENTSSEESVLETFGSGVEGNVAEEQKPLRFRLKTEPNTVDPHKTSGTGDPQVIQYQMYESLFREEKRRMAPLYQHLPNPMNLQKIALPSRST